MGGIISIPQCGRLGYVMPDKRVTELDAIDVVLATDLVLVVDDGGIAMSKKATVSQLVGVTAGYWAPLTNGDPISPELVFDDQGDVVVGFQSGPGTSPAAHLGTIGLVIDGAGSVITPGAKGFFEIAMPCTITGVTLSPPTRRRRSGPSCWTSGRPPMPSIRRRWPTRLPRVRSRRFLARIKVVTRP